MCQTTDAQVHAWRPYNFCYSILGMMQVANMKEMRRSEAKESEVNHHFVEHAQW